MTHHLPLLLAPPSRESLVRFMQSMANRSVRYFNATRSLSGTIWKGNFKSCLVDIDNYMLVLYRYIELNLLRAEIVDKSANYKWSSCQHNARGVVDKLITEHTLYRALCRSDERRDRHYRDLFDAATLETENKRITNATMPGEVLGDEHFHQKIAGLISRPTTLSVNGGDRKSKEFLNRAG